MKVCSKCKVEKPKLCFSTSKQVKDGLHSWCKECVNKQRRDKLEQYRPTRAAYDQKNADKIQARESKRRQTKEYKLQKSVWDKQYRERAGDALKERKRAYYADKQHFRRAEYQRNKQRYIAAAYERLYKIKALTPATADLIAIQAFYEEAKRLSTETGIKHEVDHIIPISRGGLHHQNNLQVLVWIENRKKGAKVMEMRSNK